MGTVWSFVILDRGGGMEESQAGRRGQDGVNIVQVILGIVMVTVGRQYTDDCPNGAANYLVVSGAIILISNLVRLVLVCGHSCVGSVVVFGSYSTWTYTPSEDKETDNPHYCNYTAFTAAFVILVVNWILMPFIVICTYLTCLCDTYW